MRYDRQTATTWPHYGRFSPAERLSFCCRLSFPTPLFSLSGSLGLPFRRHAVLPVHQRFAHETFQTRQYVMFEYPCSTPPSTVRSTWNRRFCPTLYISVDAQQQNAAGQVDPVNTRYSTILDTETDMITNKYLRVVWHCGYTEFFMIVAYFEIFASTVSCENVTR